jgi:hypothetical protein
MLLIMAFNREAKRWLQQQEGRGAEVTPPRVLLVDAALHDAVTALNALRGQALIHLLQAENIMSAKFALWH